MTRIFVTGIGTGVGKTVVSAILVEALQADYWKPIQSGACEGLDRTWVQEHISNPDSCRHAEAYLLSAALSPHAAAIQANQQIQLEQIQAPVTSKALVIEGAGGLLVPLNSQNLLIDLIPQVADAVILVSQNYLGSINHTLLSIESLRARSIPILGLVFNGPSTPSTEEWILSQSRLPCLLRLHEHHPWTLALTQKYAQRIAPRMVHVLR